MYNTYSRAILLIRRMEKFFFWWCWHQTGADRMYQEQCFYTQWLFEIYSAKGMHVTKFRAKQPCIWIYPACVCVHSSVIECPGEKVALSFTCVHAQQLRRLKTTKNTCNWYQHSTSEQRSKAPRSWNLERPMHSASGAGLDNNYLPHIFAELVLVALDFLNIILLIPLASQNHHQSRTSRQMKGSPHCILFETTYSSACQNLSEELKCWKVSVIFNRP